MVPLWRVIESPETLAACLRVAGDWLAIGVDGREERLLDYPWRNRPIPTLDALIASLLDGGVRRIVLSHWQGAALAVLVRGVESRRAELQLAGGVADLDGMREIRDSGASAVILGEALFNGSIDYEAGLRVLDSARTAERPDGQATVSPRPRARDAARGRRDHAAPHAATPSEEGPAPSTGINRIWLWVGGAVVAVIVLAVAAYFLGWIPGFRSGSPSTALATRGPGPFSPPTATPLASPPAEPAGDGTTATIETKLGNIVMEIYNESAPVAAQNFINLADAGYYNSSSSIGSCPDFVIQGGDPNGDGSGGPGYTIPDEPVVGDYTRGMVAMARTSAPNSQGSQFFICLDDVTDQLAGAADYVVFGKVTSGMDVVDAIAAGPSGGGQEGKALDPVAMDRVTVQQPSASY